MFSRACLAILPILLFQVSGGKGNTSKAFASSWSESCVNGKCTKVTNVDSQFIDFTKSNQPETLKVVCLNGVCDIRSCKRNKCSSLQKVNEKEFAKFIAKVPRCNEDGRQRGRNGRSNRTRSIISSLNDYCCNIVQSQGEKFITFKRNEQTIRPNKRIG